jgi:hypothetical protein
VESPALHSHDARILLRCLRLDNGVTKPRPNSVHPVFIGGITLLLTAFFLGAGWITTKI